MARDPEFERLRQADAERRQAIIDMGRAAVGTGKPVWRKAGGNEWWLIAEHATAYEEATLVAHVSGYDVGVNRSGRLILDLVVPGQDGPGIRSQAPGELVMALRALEVAVMMDRST